MKFKSILALMLALLMVCAFAGCHAKDGDAVELVPVTDENGEAVTDENGEVVTEAVAAEQDASQDSTAGQNGGGNAGSNNNSGGNNGGSAATTQATETTTKPQKRDVTITINIPYYENAMSTVLQIAYRAEGDSKWTYLDDMNVKMDGSTLEVELENIKGAISVWIDFKGVGINENYYTIPAGGNSIVISPYIGREIYEDTFD